MSGFKLTSDTLDVVPGAGSIEYNGQFFGTDSNNSRAQINRITQGTAVASTSGTSINFTGIPSWVKRITVMFDGVSTSGASPMAIQLGDSGGIENTGYIGAGGYYASGSTTAGLSSTAAMLLQERSTALETNSGTAIISNLSGNTWVMSTTIGSSGNKLFTGGSSKSLSATLDRIRITTANGTDTFDAGSINILYEG